MILRYLGSFLAVIVVFTQSAKESAPPLNNVQEAYEIYAAVLVLQHVKGDLMIGDTTVPFNLCLDSLSDLAVDSVIDDYKKANQQKWRLERKFSLQRPYQLVSEEELNRKTIAAKRVLGSPGIYHFSAIGLDARRAIALVEMDFVCGMLCGYGHPYLLQKKNGKWGRYDPPLVKNPDGTYKFAGFCSWNY